MDFERKRVRLTPEMEVFLKQQERTEQFLFKDLILGWRES